MELKNKFIKNIDILAFFILFTTILSGIILNNTVMKNDEVTLFNEIVKMKNGLLIYKDINVLQTPFFFYIGQVFLMIFGANYLSFRLFGIIIWLFLYYNIYKLFKKLNISIVFSFIVLLLMSIFLIPIIKVGANYNILAIALSVLSIRIYIKNENKNNIFYIIQGTLIFLIFMTKQTIGVYHFIGITLCELFVYKNNIKDTIKKIGLSILSIIMCMLIYVILLKCLNSLYEFIDYTVLGIIDFKQNTTIESLIIFLSTINIGLVAIELIEKRADEEQKVLFIFAVLMIFVTYPILCDYHSRMALIFSIISLTYYLHSKMKNKYIKVQYGLLSIICIGTLIFSINNLKTWKDNYIKDKENVYYGAVYHKLTDIIVNTIVDYIKKDEKKTIIISPEAYFYYSKLNMNNGILDYPVAGNVGINGKDKIINKIKELDSNTKIMITIPKYKQEYYEVKQFIKDHYKKVDNIIHMEVYEKGD